MIQILKTLLFITLLIFIFRGNGSAQPNLYKQEAKFNDLSPNLNKYQSLKSNSIRAEIEKLRLKKNISNVTNSINPDQRFPYQTTKHMNIKTTQSIGSGMTVDSVQPEWVHHYGAGLSSGDDAQADMVVDQLGNIYVTGSSSNPETGIDYSTIKYDAGGEIVWVKKYSGPGNGTDYPVTLALDSIGNVYVSGISEGAGTGTDFATVKYNSSGEEQWVVRYNGVTDTNDVLTDMIVDRVGNVYITGSSYTSSRMAEFITLKYNTAGIVQWNTHNGRVGSPSYPSSKIAVDTIGNVWVAVSNLTGQYGKAINTLKYNSDGDSLWSAPFKNSTYYSADVVDIEVDRSGNSYVTGIDYSGSRADFGTVKYNATGEKQWSARFSGPGNAEDYPTQIVTDKAGNIYVSGYSTPSDTAEEGIIIKYNESGIQEWIIKNNSIEYPYCRLVSIVVDDAGNIYAAGYSFKKYFSDFVFSTVKFSPTGQKIWEKYYDGSDYHSNTGNSIGLDLAGNVIISGTIYNYYSWNDIATLKYDSLGNIVWEKQYDSPSGSSYDKTTAMTSDASGNVYVTGFSRSKTSSMDYQTMKYNSSGEMLWVTRYNGSGNSTDQATAIAVDPFGNVYVTGFTTNHDNTTDYATVKYNSAGVQQWVDIYNGTGDSSDYAYEFAFDGSGNILVTGRSFGDGSRDDITTIKYTPSGQKLWVTRYTETPLSEDSPTAMKLDALGNIYIAGLSKTVESGYNILTLKYNSSGVEQWSTQFNGEDNLDDFATGLVIDKLGSVFITGWSKGARTNEDIITIKYSGRGIQQWQKKYNGTGNYRDEARDIVIDKKGDIYITGTTYNKGSYGDFTTVKYSTNGELQWISNYDESEYACGLNLVLDGGGNVYATGFQSDENNDYDIITIKYSVLGVPEWTSRFKGPEEVDDFPVGINLTTSNIIYVAGYSSGYHDTKSTLIKYKMSAPIHLSISQNYPNPFNAGTTFEYELTVPGNVTLKIYDILGREVASLVDEHKQPGLYTQHWDAGSLASGVYSYKLQIGDYIGMKKLLLLK